MKVLFYHWLLSYPCRRNFRAFILLKIAGLENNIYAQVAMVMLIGLLGKMQY
jgi:hypothetical protein